ncbi:MAG: hypothetical protein JSW44_02825, partial [Candidatus Bathyarchaeota archaeon]
MVELRAQELKILYALEKLNGKASAEQLSSEANLSDAAVMRAALNLQEKNLAKINAKLETIIKLNTEGKLHAENGLPERRLLNAVIALGGKAPLGKATEKADLEEQFVQIALGWILRKKWATYNSKTNTLYAPSAPKERNDEKLLSYLQGCKEQATLSELSQELQAAVQTLKKRQLLTSDVKTRRVLEITAMGKRAAKEVAKAAEEVTQLTPELIISG